MFHFLVKLVISELEHGALCIPVLTLLVTVKVLVCALGVWVGAVLYAHHTSLSILFVIISHGDQLCHSLYFYQFCLLLDGLVTQLCLTLTAPWTIAHQAPLSMGFPRQECWSG